MMQEVHNRDFQSLIADGKTVIEFYSQTCAHCKRTQKGLDELANELGDAVTFGKVDIAEEPALAERLDIHSLPTLLFFSNGKEVERKIGFTHKLIIAEIIKKL
jgi:thioredoxin 1